MDSKTCQPTSDGGAPAEKDSQIQRLRELVRQSSRHNPHLTTRLEKAAFLVLLRPIENVGEDHYRIGSEDGLRFYDVIKGHCQCSDSLRHGAGHPCKHRLALSLHEQLGTTINLGVASDQESRTSSES